MSKQLSILSREGPAKYIYNVWGRWANNIKNCLPIHEYTNNEGRGRDVIEILGRTLEVDDTMDNY